MRVAPAQDSEMGRGVIALRNITVGELLIQIPKRRALCRASLQTDSPFGSLLSNIRSDSDMLALSVLHELVNINDSDYAPWLRLLPATPSSLLLFTEEELEALEDPEAVKTVHTERHKMWLSWTTLLTDIGRYTTDNGLPSDWLDAKLLGLDFPSYVWARLLIGSRGWLVKNSLYLVPMADFFNFGAYEQPTSQLVDSKVVSRHHVVQDEDDSDSDSALIQVLSERTTAEGEEIFVADGQARDLVYLMHHGFVPRINAVECVSIPMPILDSQERMAGYRIRLVKALGFKEAEFCVSGSVTDQQQVLNWLLIRHMSEAGVECGKRVLLSGLDLRSELSRCAQTGFVGWFYSIDNEDLNQARIDFSRFLHEVISTRWSTTILQDVSLLSQRTYRSLNANRRSAIRYRLRQKQILSDLASYIEAPTMFAYPGPLLARSEL
eukprot:GILJ01013907.1.p1 GENE.GILJ01013907.1~~GILJ01013907.1.p1  ORF type:complete len:437 (-),score=53.66 GILJ01013907.1:476-1786(-)